MIFGIPIHSNECKLGKNLSPKIIIIPQSRRLKRKAQRILQYEKLSLNVWSEIITSMSHKCDKDLSGIIEQSPIPANLFVIL